MSVVDLLRQALNQKDWSLVGKAVFDMTGDKSYLETKEVSSKTAKKLDKEKPKNLFVDDISLEAHLIEKNPKHREKTYRKPFKESESYANVKCSTCGTQVKLPIEEYRFRKSDAEASDYTCIRCARKAR